MHTFSYHYRVLLALLFCTQTASVFAAPNIDAIALPSSLGQLVTLSGHNFGTFDGTVVSWDDFEGHQNRAKISGLQPIAGHTWSTIYGYNGGGITIDQQFAVSGSSSIKVDWSIDPETIRAFGWAGKGPYKQLYISYWRLMLGDFVTATSNHKQFYLYGNKSGFPQGMPLIPGGQNKWGFYNNVSLGPITELNPNPNNINDKSWSWANTNSKHQRWEFFIKLNEPFTAKNGVIQVWLDGVKGIDNQNYQVRHVDGEFIDFRLGHMAQGFVNTAKAWFDDIYIATTPARVELCNSSIYENCTLKHIQYVSPNDWTDVSIQFQLHNTDSCRDAPCYIYVIDKNGVPSNPITLSRPLPPTS